MMTDGKKMKAYFVGVKPGTTAGHYCYKSGWVRTTNADVSSPWWMDGYNPLTESACISGVMELWGHSEAYRCEQPEGAHRILHQDGWTCLSMWDRSGDSRRGCSATFAFEGVYEFAKCVELARGHFPGIIERMERHLGVTLGGMRNGTSTMQVGVKHMTDIVQSDSNTTILFGYVFNNALLRRYTWIYDAIMRSTTREEFAQKFFELAWIHEGFICRFRAPAIFMLSSWLPDGPPRAVKNGWHLVCSDGREEFAR